MQSINSYVILYNILLEAKIMRIFEAGLKMGWGSVILGEYPIKKPVNSSPTGITQFNNQNSSLLNQILCQILN